MPNIFSPISFFSTTFFSFFQCRFHKKETDRIFFALRFILLFISFTILGLIIAFGFARAGSSALLCVRTTHAFLSAPLCSNNVKDCDSDGKQYNRHSYNIYQYFTHNSQAFNLYSFLIWLFFLMIRTVNITTMQATIAQPKTGIQMGPKFLVVKRVPKKNVRNATVYPTAN